MRRVVVPVLALAAICVLLSVRATQCHAGILLPQQVSFGENDLEESLDSATQTHSGTSSAPSRHRSHEWPAEDGNQPTTPLELASSLPTGSNGSSSTSAPSTGGAIGSGVVLCVLNNTVSLQDDSPLGTIAEDHGFSLPDPPGTDLLRPPRSRA